MKSMLLYLHRYGSQIDRSYCWCQGSDYKLNGFRPGKAPIKYMVDPFMAEIIGEMLSDVPHSILARRGELSVSKLKVSVHEDEKEIEKMLSEKADFIFIL